MLKRNNGITLIALVVTIIVLLILAAITINIAFNNNGILKRTDETKEAVRASTIEKETSLWKMKNQIIIGRDGTDLVPLTTFIQELLEEKLITQKEKEEIEKNKTITIGGIVIDFNETTGTQIDAIPTTTSCVGKYAADESGNIIGIIYADLAVGGSGLWGDDDGKFSIPTESGLKSYYVTKTNYVDSRFDSTVREVVTRIPSIEGKERFYVMALQDIDGNVNGEDYCWYAAAYTNKIPDYNSITSTFFGRGKKNTDTMIKKWNIPAYGAHDTAKPTRDIWGVIQNQEKNGWFVPSRDEWAAFGYNFDIHQCNYNIDFQLSDCYWSSSIYNSNSAWNASFDYGCMSNNNFNSHIYVRLSTTF